MNKQKRNFTAVYQKSKGWYLGWVEEIPGVNTQGKSMKEVKENLQEALFLILQVNRGMLAKGIRRERVVRETISIAL